MQVNNLFLACRGIAAVKPAVVAKAIDTLNLKGFVKTPLCKIDADVIDMIEEFEEEEFDEFGIGGKFGAPKFLGEFDPVLDGELGKFIPPSA